MTKMMKTLIDTIKLRRFCRRWLRENRNWQDTRQKRKAFKRDLDKFILTAKIEIPALQEVRF